jgi:opacity protein-like surface antigen
VVRITSKRKHIVVALAALLAACATAQDVEQAKASWQGIAYEDVLRAWGAPARSTKTTDGRDWHTWVTESYAQSGSSVGIGLGGFRIGGGGGGVGVGVGGSMPVGDPSPPARCERTFVFDNGRVIEQYWAGPPSMCADLKRP